jgi:alkanesulfonate monooxygenase SsuD/methylene tetrahydromethanopterin reductase-like flavin-dependent oxidoreductase (luciferase family)
VYLPTFPQGDAVDGGWGPVLDVARWADGEGVGTVWIADHLFWGQPCLDALTVAAAVATTTSRTMVGTGVLQGPLRDAAALAKAATSIQDLSEGRLLLGLGVGSHEGEYDRVGQTPFRRRGEALDRQLARMAELWQPGDGAYEQRPRPGQRVPLWFGGSGPHVRRRVVAHGAGWTSAFLRPKAFGDEAARLREDLAVAGRQGDQVSVAAIVPVFTSAGAEMDVTAPLEHLSRMYGIDRRLFLGHLAAGEPEACVEKAVRFRDAGADHLALVVPADDPRPHLEALVPLLLDATS